MADEDDRVIQQHNQEDIEKFQYGCEHYRSNPKDRHELARHDVSQVICEVCDEEQKVAHICSKCGVKMGEYFCEVCKFYDDDVLPIHYKQTSTILRTKKGQFHCDDCGISSCYAVGLRDNHSCVENSMKNHCPICYEYLFDSVQSAQVLKCGHTIHENCFTEMVEQNQYRCPICYKSAHNMSATWEILNEEIEATEMPEEYRYEVPILCNDCHTTSKAFFHILGHKCSHCNSYNTRIVGAPDHPPRPYQADHNS